MASHTYSVCTVGYGLTLVPKVRSQNWTQDKPFPCSGVRGRGGSRYYEEVFEEKKFVQFYFSARGKKIIQCFKKTHHLKNRYACMPFYERDNQESVYFKLDSTFTFLLDLAASLLSHQGQPVYYLC